VADISCDIYICDFESAGKFLKLFLAISNNF